MHLSISYLAQLAKTVEKLLVHRPSDKELDNQLLKQTKKKDCLCLIDASDGNLQEHLTFHLAS